VSYEVQMMTEALEEHDKDCCTQDAPCILRTGVTKALTAHKLTPDFRVREERKSDSGKGRAWSGRKVSPTDAQLRFFSSLLTQLRELGQNEVADALENDWNKVTSFKVYSQMLDGTKTMVQKLKSAQPQKVQTEEGMYLTEGNVYKVKRSQAGHLYAMLLTDEGFIFQRGAIRNIKPEHRMTLEEAKKYGQQTGTCCQCGRELTNENSIREGIGPICAGKF